LASIPTTPYFVQIIIRAGCLTPNVFVISIPIVSMVCRHGEVLDLFSGTTSPPYFCADQTLHIMS
jgi:hypothetical protein